jgi:capsular polysaccharide transport system permease protein
MAGNRRKGGRNGLVVSFTWAVIAPLVVIAAYLWFWAADQYASTVSFSVQKEEYKSSLDVLGGIPLLSGSMISDTDILDDFLKSQELVENVDAAIDLRSLYSKRWPDDPVFAFNPGGSIEDLHHHTKRMVRVSYDNHTGLISLRSLAFTAEDARLIAQTVFDQSSEMINELSAGARADSTRFAKGELDRAFARLRQARQDLTRFRIENQIVDPTADLQGQMGILNSLQEQLASAMIEMDMLPAGLKADDARLLQAQRKIDVIRMRMEDERSKFGETGGGPGGEVYGSLIAQYEGLAADMLFAEETYRASLAAYDMAQGEARRQSRYLAAHVRPTLAETAQFPQRWSLLAIAGFFLTIAWAMCVLIYFSIRDRR